MTNLDKSFDPGEALVIGPTDDSDCGGVTLSVVLPTYKEALNIGGAIAELSAHLRARISGAFEIIVVDDDSPDCTWKIAEDLKSEYPELRVVRRVGERGLATAVMRGWQAARGEYLGVMDADLQHPASVNLALLDEMNRGADLAVATRYVEGGGVSDWSVVRRVISRGAQAIGLVILPGVVGRVSDPVSGYFMVRRAAVQGIPFDPVGYKILVEVLARGRCKWVAEVPYVFRERVEGASKVTRRVYIDYIRHLFRLRMATLPFVRFFRFGIVGLSGVVVDMGLLYLLSDPATLHWGLTRSKLVAAQCAIINNFWWNDAWTFADKTVNQLRLIHKVRRFAKFELICLIGLVLNTVILNVLFNFAELNRYVANAIAIVAVTGWNFWLNSRLNWRVATSG